MLGFTLRGAYDMVVKFQKFEPDIAKPPGRTPGVLSNEVLLTADDHHAVQHRAAEALENEAPPGTRPRGACT